MKILSNKAHALRMAALEVEYKIKEAEAKNRLADLRTKLLDEQSKLGVEAIRQRQDFEHTFHSHLEEKRSEMKALETELGMLKERISAERSAINAQIPQLHKIIEHKDAEIKRQQTVIAELIKQVGNATTFVGLSKTQMK